MPSKKILRMNCTILGRQQNLWRSDQQRDSKESGPGSSSKHEGETYPHTHHYNKGVRVHERQQTCNCAGRDHALSSKWLLQSSALRLRIGRRAIRITYCLPPESPDDY